jgi:hypothetical protein
MLESVVTLGAEAKHDAALGWAVRAHAEAVRATVGRGDRSLVTRAERALQDDRQALSFDARGHGTLTIPGHTFAAGRFEPLTLGELRRRVVEARSRRPEAEGRARLWVFAGASPVTDIGSLQAFGPPDALFQVASQFNCLESPGPYLTPVAHYLTDPTQGPRASISAFPGTLLRHYAAPDGRGGRFEQASDGRQIELLGDVCPPEVGGAKNGYLMDDTIADPPAFLAALRARFEHIRVGVHDDVEVVLGTQWDGEVPPRSGRSGGPRIAQVFTSTVAGGIYGGEGLDELFVPIAKVLQRAAYLGTLLAAAALGRSKVVLTLIGGGVFGNPVEVIWDALSWALAEVEPLLSEDLEVVLNGRDVLERLGAERLLAGTRPRGGALLVFEGDGVTVRR